MGFSGEERTAWLASLHATFGLRFDAEATLDRVDAWRDAWRPARVRALIVADSHEAGLPGDERVQVAVPGVGDLPTSYARVVHCPGYGESDLCKPMPRANRGALPRWDLLGQVALGDGSTLPPSLDLHARIAWKLDVLRRLKARGIWFAHASVVAVRGEGGRHETGRVYDALLRDSWERFVWPSVADDAPVRVWTVGRPVARALGGLPGIDRDRVLEQPPVRDPKRYRETVLRLVADLAEACPPG